MCIVSTTKNKRIHFVLKDTIREIPLQKGKKIKKNRILVIQHMQNKKMPVLLEKQAKEALFTLFLCCFKYHEIVYNAYKNSYFTKKIYILNNKKCRVKKMLGNKPSYSTMSLDIFQYVNHNIDIGLQYKDTIG